LAHARRRIHWRGEGCSLGYVILVSDPVGNYVRRLQVEILKEHGTSPGLHVTPHITLKQAFPAPLLDPFERYFDKLVNETEPFEIVVRGFGFFDEGIIFLDVVQSSHLAALQERILRDLSIEFGVQPYSVEDDRYHFHATIAHGLPRASFERARKALDGVRIEFSFVLDTLGMLLHTRYGWITYKRAALHGRQLPNA